MTPKIVSLLYDYLCTNCRYNWVYEDQTPRCEVCSETRFIDVHTLRILDLLYISEHTIRFVNEVIPGPAILLIRPHSAGLILPSRLTTFEDFTERIPIAIGRFFSPKVFTPIYMPELPYGPTYQYHYLRKLTSSN